MISAVVICYNEEKNIERCLKSLSWCSEIVVVDSFSTDSTPQIAKKYATKFIQQKFLGHKEQKNFAIENADNEWILSIDADEEVTQELKEEILEVLKNPHCDGYKVPRKNFFCGKWLKYGGWYPDWQIRLFKKTNGKFCGINPHDRVVINGKTGKLKNPILHYTYNSISQYIEKQNIYTELLSKNEKFIKLPAGIFFIYFTLRLILKFFELYIYKLGFLDGKYGIIVAILRVYITGIKELKKYALHNYSYTQ